MGVEVKPPDINHSASGFTVEPASAAHVEAGGQELAVRFGLLAIKGVGSRPIEELLDARRKDGPFTSLANLFSRTDSKNLTRGAVECLIKAGGLDSLGRRSALLASLDRAMSLGQQQRKMREIGQGSLFAGVADSPHDDFVLADVPDHSMPQLLAWEKELLNLYLSAHPLSHVASVLSRRVTTYTSYLNEEWAGQRVTLGGRVTDVRRIMTKRGDTMAAVQLEDLQGTIEVVVFPKTFAATSEQWRNDAVVLVNGTVKMRDDEPQIVCEGVETFVATEEELNRKEYLLRIRIPRGKSDVLEIDRAEQVLTALTRYPGDDRYEMLLRNGRWEARLTQAPEQSGVEFCPELMQRLEELLGPGSVDAAPVTRSAGRTV